MSANSPLITITPTDQTLPAVHLHVWGPAPSVLAKLYAEAIRRGQFTISVQTFETAVYEVET